MVDEGAPTLQIWEANFGSMVRYHKSIQEYKRMRDPPRDAVPVIIIFWGPSGCGKTRRARRDFPGAYWKTVTNWWDGYDGETVVVFDEFDGSKYKFRELLQVLDSSPMLVEVKGGTRNLRATTFVFTTNTAPWFWYDPRSVRVEWPQSPLRRRLDEWGALSWMGPGAAPVYVPGRGPNYNPEGDAPGGQPMIVLD